VYLFYYVNVNSVLSHIVNCEYKKENYLQFTICDSTLFTLT